MLGHQFVVAGDDLDHDTVGGKSGQGGLGALLGGIKEGGEARKDQFRFIAYHGMGMVRPHLSRSYSQHPETFATQGLELAVDAHARCFIQGTRVCLPIRLVADRQPQDVFGSPFDNQQPARAAVKEHRNPATLEVERHFIDLLPATCIDLRVLQDGVIQGALQTCFKKTVVIGQFQDPLAFLPQGIQVAFQMDAGFGQGAGLVGAEDIHAPQVVDRSEPFYDHLVGRHP